MKTFRERQLIWKRNIKEKIERLKSQMVQHYLLKHRRSFESVMLQLVQLFDKHFLLMICYFQQFCNFVKMYFLLYLTKSMETVRVSDLTNFVEDYYLEELERHFRGLIFESFQEVFKLSWFSDLFMSKVQNSCMQWLMKR